MRRVLAVLAAAAALAGCGHKSSQPDQPGTPAQRAKERDTQAELRSALARRALRDARRARGLGVRDVHYEVERADVRADRATLKVRLAYGVRGIRSEFGSPRTAELRRRGEHWSVTRIGSQRQRAPWEVGRYRRATTPHFVVWTPKAIDPAAGGLTTALEQGYDRMRGVLAAGRLRKRYLVVVAADASEARRMTSAIRGLESLTALTDTEVHQEGPSERVKSLASQRLIVVWPAFAAAGPEAQLTV